MHSFTIRMVLHDATWDDYIQLAAEMAARGFIDTILGASGNTYTLPDGEYHGQAKDLDTAMALSREAAVVVGRNYGVFITQSAGTRWIGLSKV